MIFIFAMILALEHVTPKIGQRNDVDSSNKKRWAFLNKCLSRNYSSGKKGVGLYGARKKRPTLSEPH
jgi:hypothetical protein